LEYHLHFNYPLYWGGIELWGETSLPIILENVIPTIQPDSRSADVHLRSSREVAGYRARASDGAVGRIVDFLFDSETWKILYLRVDSGAWICRRKALVPRQWVASVSWEDRELGFSLPGVVLRDAPTFESLSEITAEMQRRVAAYFDCV
jgi:hypothetical protein